MAKENNSTLLIRIDERQQDILKDINSIKNKLDNDVATKEWVDQKYGPTKNITWGILSTFITAIVIAVTAFIINGGLK